MDNLFYYSLAYYFVNYHSDSEWFADLREIATTVVASNSWIVKYNNLKRVHKSMLRYFDEVLGMLPSPPSTSAPSLFRTPNFTAIANSAQVEEMCVMLSQLVYLATQSQRNQVYVERIQSLDEEAQHAIMQCIEGVFCLLLLFFW